MPDAVENRPRGKIHLRRRDDIHDWPRQRRHRGVAEQGSAPNRHRDLEVTQVVRRVERVQGTFSALVPLQVASLHGVVLISEHEDIS
jgi:hypothetical protein